VTVLKKTNQYIIPLEGRDLSSLLEGKIAPLPDFITSARRELMESVAFFAFLGAIVTL